MAVVTRGAQAIGTIRGLVTDAGSRRPIAEVQISVAGTQLVAVTGTSGEFTLGTVPAGERAPFLLNLLGLKEGAAALDPDARRPDRGGAHGARERHHLPGRDGHPVVAAI